MSENKKNIRNKFRMEVFKRDKSRCRVCHWNQDITKLDAHHIISRDLLPDGGYVKENGIALCPNCHLLAERFHATGVAEPGYSIDDLYALINSSEEKARESAATIL